MVAKRNIAESPSAGRVRLQKFLSDAGVASRRHAEEMILEGEVLVNNEVADTLPVFVDPRHDKVVVRGALVRVQPLEYFIVHKPKGVVCTNSDPSGRTRAVDLLPPLPQRLFSVGRLDEESSGLLLMTNDGELTERITHPRFGIPKVYRAEVRGRTPSDLPEQMRRGVYLAEGKARASDVQIIRATNKTSILEVTLREGRNRQVRRMLARLGFPVQTLKRIRIGPLSLKGLAIGAARRLMPAEVEALRRAVARVEAEGQARRPRSAGRARKAGRTRGERSGVAPERQRRDGGRQGRRVIS